MMLAQAGAMQSLGVPILPLQGNPLQRFPHNSLGSLHPFPSRLSSSTAQQLQAFPKKESAAQMLMDTPSSNASPNTKTEMKRAVRRIRPVELSKENFAPFGQIVEAEEDGVPFGDWDAHLDLSQGTPRFYLMRLRDKDLTFDRITCHLRVTQCLGAVLAGERARPWFIAVAEPSITSSRGEQGAVESEAVAPPSPEQVRVFRIEGPRFLKFHRGTWHAGPLFEGPEPMDFYNLELADTNVTDHTTHVFRVKDGVSFEIDDS